MKTVLLFDLGGVLVENDTFSALTQLTGGEIEYGPLKNRWLNSPSVRCYERGLIDTDTFCQDFVAEWDLAISAREFGERFSAWPKGLFPGARELLDQLRANFTVAFLSNCNDLHWRRLAPITELADKAFSSHLLGTVKPDSACFEKVAENLDVELTDIVFFDDSVANVEAAKLLGMMAHHTDGFEELCSTLANLKLLPFHPRPNSSDAG
jgi:HAD superfamily hydrolase (TIGR01509 family)